MSESMRPGDKTCYTAERHEILNLFSEPMQRVLDVGCGSGYLGRAIKTNASCEIVGLELNEQLAQKAALYLDKVFCENVETFTLPYPQGYFDCIIMADVLEHLVDPWNVLVEYVQYLADDGIIILSLPNVRHYRVVGRLILGRWDYEKSGILDSTHLRFFTRKSILDMLDLAGLEPRTIEQIYRARPIAKLINWLCFNRFEAFLVQQYVVKARKKR